VIPMDYNRYAREIAQEGIQAGQAAARREWSNSARAQLNARRADHMFRFTISYARYVLTALSTGAFKLAAN
jgi:hypothetical protein